MKTEIRNFDDGYVSHLILIPDPDESRLIDHVFGDKVQNNDGFIAPVTGEIRLADGYGEHYIRLELPRESRVILEEHLQRQREWSEKTFGPGDLAKGVLDHIRKELNEIESDPRDLSEWIDVAILAFDGAWRAGFTPRQIANALVAKQTKNEGRIWPDWKTAPKDKAIEHDRTSL